MIFIDTNYFLRFLLADVPSQHNQAKNIFKQAALGRISIFTSAVVIFEIYWVLLSVYEKNKDQVSEALDSLLDMAFIDFEHYELLKESIPIYRSTALGLVDAFNLLYSKSFGAKDFKTFDAKLAKKFVSS